MTYGTDDSIAALMERVPDLLAFPGPDEVEARLAELATAHPDLVRRERIGSSRLGDPIHMYTIGDGERHALVYAGPHSNEPVGFATIVHLADQLYVDADLRHRTGFTWHLIGCVDPDAARLNQTWYDGPLTRRHYARHFYRPAFTQQAEWTFPITEGAVYFDRVLPETLALMRAIDSVRPDIMCSLHNAEYGGTYFYLTGNRPGLAGQLSEITATAGLPLNVGEAEMPGTEQLAPGVFVFPPLERIHNAFANTATRNSDGPAETSFGAGSHHYAARHGTFTMVVEVPLWPDRRSARAEDSGRTLSDALLENASALEQIIPAVWDQLDRAVIRWVERSPFASGLDDLRRILSGQALMLREHASTVADAKATVAQLLDVEDTVHLLRLRTCGTALRVLDAELQAGNHSPGVREAHRGLTELFTAWADSAEDEANAHSDPRRLVATQLGAIHALAGS